MRSEWFLIFVRGCPFLFSRYAAVIENGCGLGAWRPNSAIGYANASSPVGPFTLRRIIKQHFAHEPVALRTPEGMTVYAEESSLIVGRTPK